MKQPGRAAHRSYQVCENLRCIWNGIAVRARGLGLRGGVSPVVVAFEGEVKLSCEDCVFCLERRGR